ncbi:RICIN domain-containing protein [Rhizobium sp.]
MKLPPVIAAIVLIACATSARADDPFVMSTQWQGDDMVLTVIEGGPYNDYLKLAKREGSKALAQTWQAWADGDQDGNWIRLTSEMHGGNMCIDVDNGGELDNYVSIARCDNVSGQFWKRMDGGDYAKLTTQFRGENLCLDIVNGGETDGMAHLAPCADVKGQFWGGSRVKAENAKSVPTTQTMPAVASAPDVKK